MDGKLRPAIAHAHTLIALAERLGEDDLILEALHAMWAAAFCVGDIATVIATTTRAAELYRPENHHEHVTTFGSGHDAGVCGLGHGALALILAGRISEARVRIGECASLTRLLDHPFTTGIGFNHIAFANGLLGSFDEVFEATNITRGVAAERNFVMISALLNLFTGNALVEKGQREAGMALMSEVLDAAQCAAPAPYQPLFLAQLALFEFETENVSSALSRLDVAESIAERLDGAIMLPEVFRVRSVLASAGGDVVAARALLERAIELARSLGMVLLELRGSVDQIVLERENEPRAQAARERVVALLERIVDGEGAKDIVRARGALRTMIASRAQR